MQKQRNELEFKLKNYLSQKSGKLKVCTYRMVLILLVFLLNPNATVLFHWLASRKKTQGKVRRSKKELEQLQDQNMADEVKKKAKNEYFSDCKFICDKEMEVTMAKKILKAMKLEGHRNIPKMTATQRLEVQVRI